MKILITLYLLSRLINFDHFKSAKSLKIEDKAITKKLSWKLLSLLWTNTRKKQHLVIQKLKETSYILREKCLASYKVIYKTGLLDNRTMIFDQKRLLKLVEPFSGRSPKTCRVRCSSKGRRHKLDVKDVKAKTDEVTGGRTAAVYKGGSGVNGCNRHDSWSSGVNGCNRHGSCGSGVNGCNRHGSWGY